MSKESFAKQIIAKLQSAVGTDGSLYSESTPTSAQTAIAEAISEYLIANTIVTISYTGTLTNGSPDPIVADTMQVIGSCASTGTPANFTAWVTALQSSIAASITVQSPGTNGIVTTFQPFSSVAGALTINQLALKSAFEANTQAPLQSVWEALCGGLLTWFNSDAAKNPSAVAIAATRTGASSGTASLVSITVS